MRILTPIWPISLLLLTLLTVGCSRLNGTRIESLAGGDINLVRVGSNIADTLIEEAFPPLLPRQADQPILVATLVNEEDLQQSSPFARTLQNHIASRFIRRGYVVKEIKLRHNLVMRPGEGEFMLSRHLDRINGKKVKAQAVVLGTYMLSGRQMYLAVRLVNPGDRTIRSSWDDRLYLDSYSLGLLGLKFTDEATIRPPAESWLDRVLY